MRINLNARVRITPNDKTLQVWKDYWNDLGIPDAAMPEESPLWEIAMVFGSEMYMGFDPPFDTWIEVVGTDGIEVDS